MGVGRRVWVWEFGVGGEVANGRGAPPSAFARAPGVSKAWKGRERSHEKLSVRGYPRSMDNSIYVYEPHSCRPLCHSADSSSLKPKEGSRVAKGTLRQADGWGDMAQREAPAV